MTRSERTVLLVTYSGDDAVVCDLLTEAIRGRGWRAVRFDTDSFPEERALEIHQDSHGPGRFLLAGEAEPIDLASVESVWYRRVAHPRLQGVDPEYVPTCRDESRRVVMGLFASLRRARWVDPIYRVHQAHHKILQLELARECGLTVPDTLVTNDPGAVRAFAARHPAGVVTKMLRAAILADEVQERIVFTSTLVPEDLDQLEGLRFCPMVFQEKVPKRLEFRVTVVGERVFAASIDSQGNELGRDDWRKAGAELDGKFDAAEIPPALEESILRFMRSFGLVYGAIDLIQRPDGSFVFLEVNSAGEWGWLAHQAGLPIADALADVLTGRVRVERPAASILGPPGDPTAFV